MKILWSDNLINNRAQLTKKYDFSYKKNDFFKFIF